MPLTRRHFLLGCAIASCTGLAHATETDTTIALWPKGAPSGGGPSGPIVRNAKGAVTNVSAPYLTVYKPQRPNGAAMIVAAGGGYKRIEIGNEAEPAAKWLTDRGITVFVLTYRLPGEGWEAGPLAPLQDAMRAIRIVRARAASFGLDPAHIGVLGFSAGGHLLGMASARSAFHAYAPTDEWDKVSAKPDLAALAYPIVTLEPPYDHTSTRVELIGHHPDAAQSAEWSVQTHVRGGCPPMYLVQAEDDTVSNPQNTIILAQACQNAGVPVELQRLASGGHGFGMGKPGTASADWPVKFEAWLRSKGFIA